MSVPVITILSQDKTKISDETNYDQCITTFKSDVNLDWWQARATKTGVTPGLGVGLLVESGTILRADTLETIIVEDSELTNGDGDYIVTVYGHSIDGYYSDGSQEATKVVDLNSLLWGYNYTRDGDTVTFSAPDNTDPSQLIFGYYWYNDMTLYERVWGTNELGWYGIRFTKTSDFNQVAIGYKANGKDGAIWVDLTSLTDGVDYFITFEITKLELDNTVMTNFAILRIL